MLCAEFQYAGRTDEVLLCSTEGCLNNLPLSPAQIPPF